MVTGDHQSSAFAGQFRGQIERPLLADCFDDPVAKATIGELAHALDDFPMVLQDSPNRAGVAIDLILCARVALDRGPAGAIRQPASAFCKHPPRQLPDDEAFAELEQFIEGMN